MFSLLLFLLLASRLGALDAAWAPLEWTRAGDDSLCKQWKAQSPSIFSSGAVDSGTVLVVSSTLTGFRANVTIDGSALNLEKGNVIKLIKRKEDDADWSTLKHSFIAQTDSQSFVSMIISKDGAVLLYAFPVDGKTPMWAAKADGDGKTMTSKVLFSVDKAGQFAVLHGPNVLQGNFDAKALEKAAVADEKNLDSVKFTIAETILAKINHTGAIDGGFISGGYLYAMDNTAKKVHIYKNIDTKNLVNPSSTMNFKQFIVCGKTCKDCDISWTMIIIDVVIGLVIVAFLIGLAVLWLKKKGQTKGRSDKKRERQSKSKRDKSKTGTTSAIKSTSKKSTSSRPTSKSSR